ncbi:ankyrin repeat domain-containing protein [Acidovorax sp. 100]|uniref:ankyrin repeat domain-containing protein n=1 Tax=Acidovorax sp. 100 TaxID=2135635 RepID=UPI003511B8A8
MRPGRAVNDPHARPLKNGRTPLHHACWFGRRDFLCRSHSYSFRPISIERTPP